MVFEMEENNNFYKAKLHFDKSLELFQNSRYLDAEQELLFALNLFPERYSVINNLIRVYITLEDLSKLEIFLRKYKYLNTNQAIIFGEAYKYYFLKQHDQSLVICEELFKILKKDKASQVTEIEVQDLIAKNLIKKKDFFTAIKIYKKLILLDRNDSQIYSNIGSLLFELGKVRQAYFFFKKANLLNGKNRIVLWNIALCALTLEDLELGFNLYENRWHGTKQKKFTNIKSPESIKDIIDKKILVWDEQGLGDTLQFSRFVIDLLEHSKKITLVVDKKLKDILNHLDQNILVTDYDSLKDIDFDYQIPICSIPKLLKIKNTKHIIYKKLELPKINQNLEDVFIKNDYLNVGFAHSGNPNYFRDEYRSIPLKHFDSLFQLDKVKFFKLSKDLRTKDLLRFHSYKIEDLGNKNLLNLSYYLKKLDLIISSDTSIIHLAGILGLKSILLLSFSSDWRWFENKDNTIWYPSVKIIKQKKLNDWDSVFKDLNLEVKNIYKDKFQ